MGKYAVLNTELINYKDPTLQVSIELKVDDVQLGDVFILGNLKDLERQIYTVEDVAANTELSKVVIVTQLKVPTDERIKNINEYVGKKGDIATARVLTEREIYSITVEGLDGTPKKGSIIELQAGKKLKVVTTATANSTKVGEILDCYNDMWSFKITK